jgi:hypothetical protein
MNHDNHLFLDKEKYGRIETRHSSSIKASPKQYKRQKQRKK